MSRLPDLEVTRKNPPQGPTTAAPPQVAALPAAPPLRFRRPAAQKGFTTFPNVVLRSRRLSVNAKVLYGLLCSYAWQHDHTYPGQWLLADGMGCDVRTVQRALRELVTFELVSVERLPGLRRLNCYWLESLDTFTAEETEWSEPNGEPEPRPPARLRVVPPGRGEASPMSPHDASPVSPQDATGVSPQEATAPTRLLPRRKKTQVEEDSSSSPPAPPPDDDDVIKLLTSRGVHPATARRLARTKSPAMIRQQVDWLALRPVKRDPAGYLVQAIEGEYLAPSGDPRLRLPGERPYTRLDPPPLPVVGPESEAAKRKVRAELALRGLAGRVAAIGAGGAPQYLDGAAVAPADRTRRVTAR